MNDRSNRTSGQYHRRHRRRRRPGGLSMALHLDMYGIDTVLFETEPTTRWHPKGNTNNARTMEMFRRLGIADDVRALGVPADHPFDIAFFTRFNAFEIFRGRTPSREERLAQAQSRPATDQVVEPPHRANQMYVERLLFEQRRRAPAHRAEVRLRRESFSQDEDGVTCHRPEAARFGARATSSAATAAAAWCASRSASGTAAKRS